MSADAFDSADIFLEYARRHTNARVRQMSGHFGHMSERLRESHGFCRRLIQEAHAGAFMEEMGDDVLSNPMLQLQAFALSEDYEEYFIDPSETFDDFVESRLYDFEAFFKVILCGMKMPASPLHRLGGDSSLARLIGSFLGVPLPPLFLQAMVNMGYDVFHPYTLKPSFKFSKNKGKLEE